jgi:hypothetical protein
VGAPLATLVTGSPLLREATILIYLLGMAL